jgi:hypothetical protein
MLECLVLLVCVARICHGASAGVGLVAFPGSRSTWNDCSSLRERSIKKKRKEKDRTEDKWSGAVRVVNNGPVPWSMSASEEEEEGIIQYRQCGWS